MDSAYLTNCGVCSHHLLLALFSDDYELIVEFNVENICSLEWNDESFENLVLAEKEKKLVQSLIEAHDAGDSGFDDFVQGKGKGLVINLFGNPGVGKTLTAEAMSEREYRVSLQ